MKKFGFLLLALVFTVALLFFVRAPINTSHGTGENDHGTAETTSHATAESAAATH